MLNHGPLTIEILGGNPSVVLDRVKGGTCYLDHAKRIGRYLIAIVEGDFPPHGYRILDNQQRVLYKWCVSDEQPS